MAASADRGRFPMRLGAGLLTVAIGLAASLGAWASPAAAGTKPTITGSGSSYAALAINQWVALVSSLYGDNIDYSVSSSVIGLNDFAQYPQVDFGASEIGYSTGQADQEPPSGFDYQYLPDIAGATCLDYNLSNSFGQRITNLHLDSSVMAGIFSGAITTWNDPQIQTLNPGVNLPKTPIIVVYRSDASGDNFIFSDYLYDTQQSAWNHFTTALHQPSGAQAIWPVPTTGSSTVGSYTFKNWTSANGSNIASDYVGQNAGSITYVETGYALLHHDPCAYIQNQSGAYVKPSAAADAIALQNDALQPDLEQTLTPVFTSPQSGAYPISAYSYLVMAEQSEINAAAQPIEAQFVQFLACAGQEAAATLGYSPLPPNLVQADFAAVDRIDGVQLPTPTASNCPDPYITGSFNAAPPPTVSSTPTAKTSAGAATSPVAGSGGSGSSRSTSASGASGSHGGSDHGTSGTSSTGPSGTSGAPGSTKPGSATSTASGTQLKSGSPGSSTPSRVAASRSRARPLECTTLAPIGQHCGTAMFDAVNRLLDLPVPARTIMAVTTFFLLVLVGPPLILLNMRRRRLRSGGGPGLEDDDD